MNSMTGPLVPIAQETEVQSQVESYQRLKKKKKKEKKKKKKKKRYLIPPCLTFSIIRYISRVNQGKEVEPPHTIGVVATEKGAFRLPSTTVAFFNYY